MALSMPHQNNGGVEPGDTQVIITPTTGNWLIAFVNWAAVSENVITSASVGDASRNLWTLVWDNFSQAFAHNTNPSLYSQIWVCPNVQYPGWPSVYAYMALMQITSFDVASCQLNVFEIAGMVNGYLTVRNVTTKTTGAASTFSMTLPAPTGGVSCLMLATACGSGATTSSLTTGGWTTVTGASDISPNFNSAGGWIQSSVTQTMTFTAASGTQSWAGVAVSIQVTGTVPTINNVNFPTTELQVGFNQGLSTPSSSTIWTTLPGRVLECDHERGIQFELGLVQSSPTDLTLRNDDGALSPRTGGAATATSNGTSTTLNTTAVAAATVTVGDYFMLYTSGGTTKELNVFQVTSIVTSGGNATINFLRADNTGGGATASTATGDVYHACPIVIYLPYRIVATWQGRVYPVVTGWMERWPQVWTDPHWGESMAIGIDPIATLTANDYSPLQGEILRRNPQSYWPCGDSSGVTTAQNLSGVGTAVLTQTASSHGTGAAGTVSFGISTQNVNSGFVFAGSPWGAVTNMGDTGTMWGVNGLTQAEMATQGWALIGNDSTFPSIANGVTIVGVSLVTLTNAALIEGASQPPTVMVLSNTLGTGFQGRTIKIEINNSASTHQLCPEIEWWNSSTGATTTTQVTATTFTQGETFALWALVFNQTSWAFYIGSSSSGGVISQTSTCTIVPNFDRIDIGGEADSLFSGDCYNGQHCHIAIFPRKLTAGEISDLYSAVTFGYVTNAPAQDQTIARKLNTVNWKGPRILNWTTTATGVEILGTSIADKVTQLADYNADKLFSDAAGYLQFRARSVAVLQSVRATIGDRPDLGEIPYIGDADNFEIDYDPTYLYNNVTVQNAGIVNTSNFFPATTTTTFVENNSSSISSYGFRSLGKSVSFNNDSYTSGVAQYYINQYGNPQLRVASVVLDATSNNTVMAFVLSVEVGDLVTVNKRPLGAPMISVDCVVLDIQHTILADEWQTTLTMGAAPV